MKLSRPTIYLLLAATAVAAWIMTSPEQKASAKKSKGTPTRSARSNKGTDFTEEDYKASFARLNEQPKNAFRPIVARTVAAGGGVLSPDAVPAEVAGGDPNWFYTGTAIVDGVPEALVENRATLEGEFLRQGQTWKRAKVAQIGPETLVLTGPTGRQYTLRLAMPSFEDVSAAPAGGFRPLQPLNGPIGGNVAVRPENPTNRPNRPSTSETRDAN